MLIFFSWFSWFKLYILYRYAYFLRHHFGNIWIFLKSLSLSLLPLKRKENPLSVFARHRAFLSACISSLFVVVVYKKKTKKDKFLLPSSWQLFSSSNYINRSIYYNYDVYLMCVSAVIIYYLFFFTENRVGIRNKRKISCENFVLIFRWNWISKI